MRRFLLVAAAVAGFAPAAAAQDIYSFAGKTMTVPFAYCPEGWVAADGRALAISNHAFLFSLIATTYGGDGVATFALPDLRGAPPASGQTALLHCIALDGEPYLGQVIAVPLADCPGAWVPADGRLLTISDHAAFYSLIGNRYGGTSPTDFALPDLRNQPSGSTTMTYCIATEGTFPPRS